MERFRVMSGQGYDEEGNNVLIVIIWVEGDILEYEPCCVAKTLGKFLTRYWHAGGRPDANTKENTALEKV